MPRIRSEHEHHDLDHFFAGAVAHVASIILAASCGGSGDRGTLGTGSGKGTPLVN
jgi:hypothetical protein